MRTTAKWIVLPIVSVLALAFAACSSAPQPAAAPTAVPAKAAAPAAAPTTAPAAPAAAPTTAAAPAAAAPAKPASGDPIKVGVMIPMSGSEAQSGELLRPGVEQGANHVNKTGGVNGRPIQLVFADHQALDRVAVTAMTKLAEVDKVTASIAYYSGPILAALPIAAEKKIMLVNPGGQAPNLIGVSPWLFSTVQPITYEATTMASYAFKDLGIKSIAIIHGQNDANTAGSQAFSKAYQALGGKVTGLESNTQLAQDWKPQLTKLIAAKPEAIWIMGIVGDSGVIIKQGRELGFTGQYLSYGALAPMKTDDIKRELAGTLFVYTAFDRDSTAAPVKDMADTFAAIGKQRSDLIVTTALAWDAIHILAKAMSIGGVSGDALREGMLKIGTYEGATMQTRLLPDGSSQKTLGLYQFGDDGKYKLLKTIAPN